MPRGELGRQRKKLTGGRKRNGKKKKRGGKKYEVKTSASKAELEKGGAGFGLVNFLAWNQSFWGGEEEGVRGSQNRYGKDNWGTVWEVPGGKRLQKISKKFKKRRRRANLRR